MNPSISDAAVTRGKSTKALPAKPRAMTAGGGVPNQEVANQRPVEVLDRLERRQALGNLRLGLLHKERLSERSSSKHDRLENHGLAKSGFLGDILGVRQL